MKMYKIYTDAECGTFSSFAWKSLFVCRMIG